MVPEGVTFLGFFRGFSSLSMIPLFIALGLGFGFPLLAGAIPLTRLLSLYVFSSQVGVRDLDRFPIIACYRWPCAPCWQTCISFHHLSALGHHIPVVFRRPDRKTASRVVILSRYISWRSNVITIFPLISLPVAVLFLALFTFF